MNQNSYRVLCENLRIYSISYAIEMTGIAAAAATDADTTGSIYRTGFSDYSYNHNAFAFFVVVVVLSKCNHIELSQLQYMHVNFTSYADFCGLQTQQSLIWKNWCYSLVRFAFPMRFFSLSRPFPKWIPAKRAVQHRAKC